MSCPKLLLQEGNEVTEENLSELFACKVCVLYVTMIYYR